MRSVRRATWTSVLPVSVGLSPNFSISSCLRSWVRVMRPVRLAEVGGNALPPGSPTQRAGLLDVEGHLRHEGVDGVKAPLPPQPGQEIDPQDLAVEVDGPVEQVRLHQQ